MISIQTHTISFLNDSDSAVSIKHLTSTNTSNNQIFVRAVAEPEKVVVM